MKFDRTNTIETLHRVVRRMHYPLEVMLACVRWYAAYRLGCSNIKEMMAASAGCSSGTPRRIADQCKCCQR